MFGNHMVREPSGAIPLQGTWIGAPSDYLAMKVTVRVAALAAGSARHPTMLCNECSGSTAAVGSDRTEL
jgi:hypothetical protein